MNTLKEQLNNFKRDANLDRSKSPEEISKQQEAIRKILRPASSGIPEYIIPFGKYKGKLLADVAEENLSYLKWMLTLPWAEEFPTSAEKIHRAIMYMEQ